MVVLYSTHCPKCNILEKKLANASIEYREVNDVDYMLEKGIINVPVIEVNGALMEFGEAVRWIQDIEKE